MKSSSAHVLTSFDNVTDSLQTVNVIVNAALEAKGTEVKVLDIHELSDVSEYIILITSNSDRHAQGVTNRILDHCQEVDHSPISVEGLEKAHWVLVDFGEIVVHIFYRSAREHYDLDSLWMKAKQVPISRPNRKGMVRVG